MAHAHSLYDTDPHFRIDPVTRNIVNMSGKVVLIQYDHNSERFTFEIPRYVDGHDMSLCNKVEVHYINGSSNAKRRGLYVVDDLQVDPKDEEYVIGSWLISRNATEFVGILSFMLRFKCETDEVVDYEWGTNIHSGISVSQGIYNTDYVSETYVDILEQWRMDLIAAGVTMTGIEQTAKSTEDGGINEVTMTFSDGTTGTFTIRNGSKGLQGDPFTYDDFTTEQLEALKGTKGDAFTYDDFTDEQLAALTGPTGAYIQTIVRTAGTGASGTIDTYTITLSDGRTSTFSVYNGADGDGAGDMLAAIYDPTGRNTDIFAYVDNHSKWNDKQNTLTFDSEPKSGSTNPITSDGVYSALQSMENSIGDISSVLDSINGEVV